MDYFILNDVDLWARLFLLDASLVVGMQTWSWDDFIFIPVDRCGASVLVGRKPGCGNAGLVIGLFCF